jgi:hypothetical protein
LPATLSAHGSAGLVDHGSAVVVEHGRWGGLIG